MHPPLLTYLPTYPPYVDIYLPGAPELSGGISRRDKKTIRPAGTGGESPQGDFWETVKRRWAFAPSTSVLRVISRRRTVTLVTAATEDFVVLRERRDEGRVGWTR